jgi:hypothetical protein
MILDYFFLNKIYEKYTIVISSVEAQMADACTGAASFLYSLQASEEFFPLQIKYRIQSTIKEHKWCL